jgi:hypothetical protein
MPFLKWPQGWVTWSRIEHLHEGHDCLPIQSPGLSDLP